MMSNKVIFVLVIGFFTLINSSYSQIKGVEEKGFNKDTIFVFESPRPLVETLQNEESMHKTWGIDVLLSGSGFGFGAYLNIEIFDDLLVFSHFFISGARNTDEIDLWDREKNRYIVSDKINRVFRSPFTFGVNKYLFTDVLDEKLKPYLALGVGPTFILSTPYEGYENSFFASFSEADTYTRVGGFIGTGVEIGAAKSAVISINARYYFIPFGGDGIESIKDNPMKDLGGLSLSLSLGARF